MAKAKIPAKVISILDFLRSEINIPIACVVNVGAIASRYLFTVGKHRFPEWETD